MITELRVTSYGWLMDYKGNKFPPEYKTYEAYMDKLRDDYIKAYNEGMATNPEGWRHANCDHAYGICGG
jgi:hypothetical protein